MSYFDRPENSSSAIGVRLSSDASAIEQVISTRLGVICETIALSCFGLLFGMFFSWELTLVVVLITMIIVLTISLNVHFNVQLKKQSDSLLQRANTVRSHFNAHWILFFGVVFSSLLKFFTIFVQSNN